MMGLLAASLVFLAPLVVAPGQEAEPVLLRWNIPEGKALGFKSSIQQVGAAPALDFDLSILSKATGTPEATPETKEKMRSFFESFKPPKEFSMSLILKRKAEDRIAVLLVSDKIPVFELPDPKMTEMFNKLQDKVQLRGEIDPAGAVESFWLATPQKNLVAILCELPKHRVKVGDHWPINVNLAQMGHGFIAEKTSRVNRVAFSSIEKGADGEVVAVLDYLIAENLEGPFQMGDQVKPTTMMMTFAGRCRFSVTKGAWKSFTGRLTTKATGIMTANSAQELALDPLPSVPEELLKLR